MCTYIGHLSSISCLLDETSTDMSNLYHLLIFDADKSGILYNSISFPNSFNVLEINLCFYDAFHVYCI